MLAGLFRFLMCSLWLFATSGQAHAATVVVMEPETTSRAARILIEGEIETGDEILFSNLALQTSKALVMFAVEGGDLPTLLRIGDTIQLKKFETVVPENVSCPAICALGWLSGAKHYLQNGALISFNGSTATEGSGPLVETYLAKLAISASVGTYITQAASAEEPWLTAEEALLQGFSVTVLDEQLLLEPDISIVEEEPEPPPQPVAQPKPKPVLQPSPQKRFQTVAGLDLFGYDLPGMPLREATWESCSIECSIRKNCKAFTYNNKSRTCFLKSHADFAVHYEPASSGVIPILVRGIRQTSIQMLQRVDVVGNDYRNTEGGSLEDCLRSCDSDTSCAGFSYIPKKKQCWMKSAVGETVAKQGVVSGVK